MRFLSGPEALLNEFELIADKESFAVLHFYERNKAELALLPFADYYRLRSYYANALFAAQAYAQHIEEADWLIEQSIIADIRQVDGRDVYLHFLFSAMRALFYLGQYEASFKRAKALVGMRPHEPKYLLWLRRNLMLRRPSWVRWGFAGAILSLASWLGVSLFSLFLVDPFFPYLRELVFWLRQVSAIMGAASISFGIFGRYYYVERELRKLIRARRPKKAAQEQ